MAWGHTGNQDPHSALRIPAHSSGQYHGYGWHCAHTMVLNPHALDTCTRPPPRPPSAAQRGAPPCPILMALIAHSCLSPALTPLELAQPGRAAG